MPKVEGKAGVRGSDANVSLDLFVLTSFNKYVYLHLEPETYTHKMINNQETREWRKKHIEILSNNS